MSTRKVKVLSDSSCDLPKPLLQARGIETVPLTVILGDESLRDGVDISPDEFYARVQREGIAPHTSQVSPAEYQAFFARALADGGEAVYVGLSSGLSGSLQGAHLTAQSPEFAGRVRVVDSLGASVGLGLMVLKAADLADEGRSAEEIVNELEQYRGTVHHLVTLDTLDFAARSGRVTRFSSIASAVLDIKPMLTIDMEGHLVPFAKVRGRKRSLSRLFEEMERLGGDPRGKRVGISHAAVPEVAEELAERFRSQYGAAEVVVGQIGATIGAHVGPGCVAIFFEGPAGRGH